MKDPPERVLLVAPAASWRIAAYLEAATTLGIELVIAAQGEHSLIPAVRSGLHIDPADPEESLARILATHRASPFAAVVSADDATVELAARAASALGLPHNPPEAARRSRRKDMARACLHAAGVSVPAHWRIDLTRDLAPQIASIPFPCVAKPVALSGSRGVIRCDDPARLVQALQRIERIVSGVTDADERGLALVERYVPGAEYAVEAILDDGVLRPIALFDKPEPLTGPYFEETFYVMPSRLPAGLQQRLLDAVAAACRAYGLVRGPVHAEVRLDPDGRPWIIEVASRTIGGQCARLLTLAAGVSLEVQVLAQAVGRSLALAEPTGAGGVLMLPIAEEGVLRRVEGVFDALAVPGVVDIEISLREGQRLIPLPEGDSYLGFVFARAADPAAAEGALRAALTRLRVVTAPVWDLEHGLN